MIMMMMMMKMLMLITILIIIEKPRGKLYYTEFYVEPCIFLHAIHQPTNAPNKTQ